MRFRQMDGMLELAADIVDPLLEMPTEDTAERTAGF
ncbi:hypothetical protein X772_32985 [Mesorhizobium sp. LSJC280B00]|nr:hypothetical protein X772_32985 [Mesorhizobium sp. LSJC280B00]